MEELFEILNEVLAEHPEYAPAVEIIVDKWNAHIDAEIAALRGSIIPGSNCRKSA